MRALSLPGAPDVFTDDSNSVFENDINALAQAGITHVCNPPDNAQFCPDAPVTRGQMAAFLVEIPSNTGQRSRAGRPISGAGLVLYGCGMITGQHDGELWLEGEVDSAQPGTVSVGHAELSIRLDGVEVDTWPVSQVTIERQGPDLFLLLLGEGRLIFRPLEPDRFEVEARAVSMRSRLRTSPPESVPAPRSTALVQTTSSVSSSSPSPASVTQPGPPKNPGAAAALSALWTGLGQIYNGRIAFGVFLMAVQAVNVLLMLVFIGFLTFFLTWVVAIVHAYKGAESYNRIRGYAPSR